MIIHWLHFRLKYIVSCFVAPAWQHMKMSVAYWSMVLLFPT